MVKVHINGKEIEVEVGSTVMQACRSADVEIPHFCYHERLQIAGNCRMCLVEIEKAPKPVASCVQTVSDGMVIKTNTPMVKKAREGVMEFMLINHPLDCPICDQAGECDLQDQAMKYGKGESYFHEDKRAVVDKYMGPLISTNMTRCIHCTRCVRFLEDVAGTPELGALERGESMQIGTYIEASLTSELSGNIIDLCPVGALTSKPYEFKARSWELKKTESIDVLDAVGSNIRIDSKGREVMRILPRLNEEINEEWISDKARFSYDGLKYQRLDRPMVKQNGILQDASWEKSFAAIAEKIKVTTPSQIGAIAGDLTDVESMFVMKELLSKIGSHNYDCRQDGSLLSNEHRSLYIFNTGISNIQESDFCLIFGSNPRLEAPILNAKIGYAARKGLMDVALIGNKADLTYEYKHLGNNPWILKQLSDGDHPYCSRLKSTKKPMIIIGADAMASSDYEASIYYAKSLSMQYGFVTEEWNGYNILQRAASRVGGLDIGFIPSKGGLHTNAILSNCSVIFLMGADEVDISLIPQSTFVIYIGHHGDKGASRADVILPAAAYTEKDATYVNLEGKVQYTKRAVFPPNMAQEDWKLITELSKALGLDLGYNTITSLRKRIKQAYPVFIGDNKNNTFPSDLGKKKDFSKDYFHSYIKNYYLTDPITRTSPTMAKCSIESLNRAI
jgi:NADH-quinone oxidoreductase subunit G